MSNGNALGFGVMGGVMWLLPLFVPQWFPHLALDGSSTRAIWIQLMGCVQLVIGATFLALNCANVTYEKIRTFARARGLAAAGEWSMPGRAVAPASFGYFDQMAHALVNGTAADTGRMSGVVTLRGEHAALWRALNQALPEEEKLLQFAEQIRTAVRRQRALHPHPVATAMFRYRPQHSLVHLVNPDVIDFAELNRANLLADLERAVQESAANGGQTGRQVAA